MTKDECIGKIVILKQDFIEEGRKRNLGIPAKITRPYLVLEIPTKRGGQLFAVPMQTSVPRQINNAFFEKLNRRLECWDNCTSGLVFSQMIPITTNQIAEKKFSENNVPSDERKRNAALKNIRMLDSNSLSVEVQPSLNFLKKYANMGTTIFSNQQFCQAYKSVSNDIYKGTIRMKDQKLDCITKKAENYLHLYVKFLHQNAYGYKSRNAKEPRVKLPSIYSRIDKLVKFVREYNKAHEQQKEPSNPMEQVNQVNVKTSLQPNPLIEKYKLTNEQFTAAETLAAKDKQDLEKIIRKNISFAPDGEFDAGVKAQILAEQAKERASQQKQPRPKTQEKNIAKPEPKKNSQNSR